MTEQSMILAWKQRQEYLANQSFEQGEVFIQEPIICEDAYISEEERYEELCHQQK